MANRWGNSGDSDRLYFFELQSHCRWGLQPTRLLHPWDFPGKSTGVGCHCLLQYADDTTLMAESEEELKSLLMKVTEESEKAGLKLNIGSSPITSWQIDRETMETVTDYFRGAPKSLQMVIAALKLKDACSLGDKLRQT